MSHNRKADSRCALCDTFCAVHIAPFAVEYLRRQWGIVSNRYAPWKPVLFGVIKLGDMRGGGENAKLGKLISCARFCIRLYKGS